MVVQEASQETLSAFEEKSKRIFAELRKDVIGQNEVVEYTVLAIPALRHRVKLSFEAVTGKISSDEVVRRIIAELKEKLPALQKARDEQLARERKTAQAAKPTAATPKPAAKPAGAAPKPAAPAVKPAVRPATPATAKKDAPTPPEGK